MTIQTHHLYLIPCQAAPKDTPQPLTLGRCIAMHGQEKRHSHFLLQRSSVIIMKEIDGASEIRRPGNISGVFGANN